MKKYFLRQGNTCKSGKFLTHNSIIELNTEIILPFTIWSQKFWMQKYVLQSTKCINGYDFITEHSLR